MRYLLIFPIALLILSGCETLPEKDVALIGQDSETAASPHTVEVNALLAQKYIDPLSDYIDKHAQDPAMLDYVQKISAERQRRCADVALLYQKREKDEATLAKLQTGYQRSCPTVVSDFEKQVAGNNAASEQVSVETDSDRGEKPPQEKEQTPEGGQIPPEQEAKNTKGMENCKVLYAIENYLDALKACTPFAGQGNAEAQYRVAMIHRLNKDYAQALPWAEKAAMQEAPKAQYLLGGFYAEGKGVEQDYAKAVAWFKRAAESGFAEAQLKLGQMYINAQGVSQNYDKAVEWLKKSGEQGNAEAYIALGDLYHSGTGVQKSDAQAQKWLHKAAEQGHVSAQLKLGLLYSEETNKQKDYMAAYIWLSLAVLNGSQDALEKRKQVEARLNDEQRKQAEAYIKEFAEKYNKK